MTDQTKYSHDNPYPLSTRKTELVWEGKYDEYGSYSASIRIEDFAVLEGYLPPRALGLVMEWADIHKDELIKDWELARAKEPLFQIEPLK